MMKQFGGKITKELKRQYANSPNWDENKFNNLEETTINVNFHSLPKILYKQFFDTHERIPSKSLPIQSFDKASFLTPSDKAKFIWYGHSVLLMRINNKTVLIDPMLGPNASPIGPFSTKRFSDNTLDLIDQFPPIDLLLLTHDHYDHLDLASFEKLMPKVKQYFVAMGTARHLTHWGIHPNLIKEFDWWDHQSFEGIDITFTPSRHFSGRGLTDRAQSLWGGWVFATENEKIYFSGDGGYGTHFKEIGEKLGPFDFGIMECGQYNENWHQIHMYPEESVQAGDDTKSEKIMPVHWCGFSLAQHSWTEPVERFTKEAKKQNIPFLTPELGEIFSYESSDTSNWWEGME